MQLIRLLFSCVILCLSTSALALTQPTLRTNFGQASSWRGSPIVVDLDSDGDREIIVPESFDSVTAFHHDGTVLWSNTTQGRCWAGAVLADLDGNGTDEVVAGDNTGNIHAWTAAGVIVAGWPQAISQGAQVNSLAAADIDGDGDDEIIVYSSLTDFNLGGGGCVNMYVFEGDGTVRAGWPHYGPADSSRGVAHACAGGFNNNVAVGDLDFDGDMEIVMAQDYFALNVFRESGQTIQAGNWFNHCTLPGPFHWGEIRTYLPYTAEQTVLCGSVTKILEFTYSPPLIADIDLDGQAEILAVGNAETPGSLGPFSGSALVVFNLDRTHKTGFAPYKSVGTAFNGPVQANPTVVAGDLAGDSKLEVLVTHLDGTLKMYNPDGTEAWSVTLYSTDQCTPTEPLLADVTGDNVPEVIVATGCKGTDTGTLYVIDAGGSTLLSFPLPFNAIAAPTLADVDGNAQPEMVFGGTWDPGDWKSQVYIYDWSILNPAAMPWPTGRGNYGHTAEVFTGNLIPLAVANTSSTTSTTSTPVDLDAVGSMDPDGTIVKWDWDFGNSVTADATASSGAVTYTFLDPGTYNVMLTVTDDQGATGSAIVTITVTGPDMGAPAVAMTGLAVDGNVNDPFVSDVTIGGSLYPVVGLLFTGEATVNAPADSFTVEATDSVSTGVRTFTVNQ